MGRVVETKVRIGFETNGGDEVQSTIGKTTKAAKDLQQTFIGLDEEKSNLYKDVSTLAPEVQSQINSLRGSFAELKRDFGTLPSAVKSILGEIISNFQAGNLQAVSTLTASPAYSKAPEMVQQNVAQMFQSTYELEKAGVGAEFGKLESNSGEFNAGRYKRLSGSYESRLDTFERRLDGAEVDYKTMPSSDVRDLRRRLGEIGSVGRQARGAAGAEQEGALGGLDDRYSGYSQRLDEIIKERTKLGIRDGVETDEQTYSPNFERLFERRLGNIGAGVQGLSRNSPDGDLINMERRLARAGGDLAYNQPALKEDAFKDLSEGLKQQTDALGELLGERRIENADRMGRPFSERLGRLDSEMDDFDPYTGSRRKLGGLRNRLNQAKDELAGMDGALETQVFQDLTQSVEALTEKLDDNVQAYNESGRGGGGGGGDGPDGPGGGVGGMIASQLSRMGGGGMLGGMLSKLIPGVAVAGGAVAAYNWADRAISGANRQARETSMAEADLARQYGIEGDPFTMFRSGKDGYADRDLLQRGYAGSDAARIMAQLDRPSGRSEAVEDVKDIAAFSYSTGLDESRVTDAVRMMGLAGTYKPGGAETPLETLKMALTEGVRNGVSQADTMNALVDISQQALAEGRRLSPEALAFQAALQDVLAKTGNPLLKGQAGAEVQGNLNDLITGKNDPAIQMIQAQTALSFSGKDLGLTGDALRNYEQMRLDDPKRAAIDALGMATEGGANPQLMVQLAENYQDTVGSIPQLNGNFLDNSGITGARKYQFTGPDGIAKYYREAARNQGKFETGTPVSEDVQGDNALAQQSAEISGKRKDQADADSKANVIATGQTEENMQGAKRGAKGAWNWLRNQADDPNLLDEQQLNPDGTVADPIGNFLGIRRKPRNAPLSDPNPPPAPPPAPSKPQPKAAPPTPKPEGDVGSAVGREAYFVMAGGLEGTEPDASNERTGAFGFSQVMPGNLIGDGEPDRNGLLQTGWDQSFLKTPEGRKWKVRFNQEGLSYKDPIPDQMAEIGKTDPNALPMWYGNLPGPAQETVSGFMQSMTEYQLGQYYNTARADGAGHDEATKRTMAGWYGGYAWLDRDDPERALSLDNPNYTKGHGTNGEEPSVQEYINKALKNGTFDLPDLRQQSNQRVDVHIHGLERIQVQGANQTASTTIRNALSDIITAVSQPEAHHGMG